MKKAVIYLLLASALISCGRRGPEPLKLVNVFPVEGRQGVATDGDYYYVSSSTALYKYDLKGNLILSNENPFEGMTGPLNHIGDIDVHEGEIFAGCEWTMDGVIDNIQIVIYDTETLLYKRAIPWNKNTGQVECCGLAVDREHGRVWMSDWVKGDHLYCYDLSTSEYVGKVALNPEPILQQGIYCMKGKMIISCDDGDADKDEPDNLYIADMYDHKGNLKVVTEPKVFRVMSDFKKNGEIEGLTFNPLNGEMTVLANRGTRIVKGVPKGFYEGYDKEIHELYVYSK